MNEPKRKGCSGVPVTNESIPSDTIDRPGRRLSPGLTEDTYQLFCGLIKSRLGLSFSGNKRLDLERAIQVILQKTNISSPFELYTSLKGSHESSKVWETVIHYLTVNETYFFRNKPHFQALREMVLPDVISRRRDESPRRLKIWSAGCSSGEEPYSVAMVLVDILPSSSSWDISIIGTDIKQEALERARLGRYKEWSFRTTDRSTIERFFHHHNGHYQLSQDIMKMVKFHHANLRSPLTNGSPLLPFVQSCDLIICRNVTIYFDRPTISTLMTNFYGLLAPGGWLLVGESEPPPGEFAPFVIKRWKDGFYYWKNTFESLDCHGPTGDNYQSKRQDECRNPPSRNMGHHSETKKRGTRRIIQTSKRLTDKAFSQGFETNSIETNVKLPVPIVTINPDKQCTTRKSSITSIPKQNDISPETSMDPNIEQAFHVADAGRLDDAERLCLDILDKNSLSADVYYLLAMIALARDDQVATESYLKKALYLDGDFLMAHYNLWSIYQAMKRTDAAARQLKIIDQLLHAHHPDYVVPRSGGMTVNHFRDIVDRNENWG